MHGLGNDFAVINTLNQAFTPTKKHIQQMASRRTGIGFDQLLLLENNTQQDADFNYRIFNADGNEVGNCGNGARCIGLYIKQQQLLSKPLILLKTRDRILQVLLNEDSILVNMGIPNFDPSSIPYLGKTSSYTHTIEAANQTIDFALVSVGNPHMIIFVSSSEQYNIDTIGSIFNQHPDFPRGINVSFAQIINREKLLLNVYERGVGRTQACGTAACAATVVGRQLGHLSQSVTVIQPGGELCITWQDPGTAVMMQGDASCVYHGTWLQN